MGCAEREEVGQEAAESQLRPASLPVEREGGVEEERVQVYIGKYNTIQEYLRARI